MILTENVIVILSLLNSFVYYYQTMIGGLRNQSVTKQLTYRSAHIIYFRTLHAIPQILQENQYAPAQLYRNESPVGGVKMVCVSI